jgi:Rod binding domain-containing protein
MAVSLPSDIVMDVVRAAEPDAIRAARERLSALAGAAVPEVAFSLGDLRGQFGREASTTPAAGSDDPLVKFEGMVLGSFIKSMLPEDTQTVYGGGMAGDMWRSLMADEMGTAIAQAGGVGIAQSLVGHYHVVDEAKVPVGQVSGGPEKSGVDAQRMLSDALVSEFQRRFLIDAAARPDDETGITRTRP